MGSIDWSMFEPDKLELNFLGIVYRTRHSEGYRRHPDERTRDVDHVTGAPLSEARLLPVGHAHWISGIELALSSPLYPDKLATASLGLYWKPRTGKLSAEEEIENERRLGVDFKTMDLIVSPSNWTSEEIQAHAELEYRWKKALLKMSQKGPPWVLIRPPVVYVADGEGTPSVANASGFGRDGLPRVAQTTAEALDQAEKVIPGTRYAKGAKSALAVAPAEVRAHAMREVPWALEHAKRENAGQ